MAEHRTDETPRRYEETTEPQNPPNSMLTKGARRAAVWSYFVPVVVLFVVAGIALVYWANQPRQSQTNEPQRSEIGTAGREDGGFDPAPKPGDVRDEVEFRGDDLAPITNVRQLGDVNARQMNGRRVAIEEAEVDSTSGSTLWVRDGDARFAVIVPEGGPTLQRGAKVSITGRLVADTNGTAQIRADRVQAK
jgi:hypothetical protein